MKFPDKYVWTVWYCLVLLGVLTSLILAEFASIPFMRSVWLTVPLFFLAGNLVFFLQLRAVRKAARKATTPLGAIEVRGIGAVSRFADRCEADLEAPVESGSLITIPVVFDTDGGPPSERQVRFALEFKRRFAQLRPAVEEELQAYLFSIEQVDEFASVDRENVSISIGADDSTADIEIYFETKEEYSDMYYAVCLKDWRVAEVYAAD